MSSEKLTDTPCGASLAWTSALVGGLAIRDDDLAASMVLFFILLIFLVIGLLRVYAARTFSDILTIFLPTVLFVICLITWSALRAHLSNTAHSPTSSILTTQAGLSELVAANGLVSCTPMLLCETTFQVFGLLAKRVVPTASRWIRNTAYVARGANLLAFIMVVVACCEYASFLTAWLDQTRLVSAAAAAEVGGCGTTMLGRDLTLLPLVADAIELVVLFVLTVLVISMRLRYQLAPGVVVHVVSIQSCLAFHFGWKCAKDWAAFQNYLSGAWTHSTSPEFDLKQGQSLEDLGRTIRTGAEDPTLFYILGIVPLVLAMILIYTLNLASYTKPPPTAIPAQQQHLMARFRLMLDPISPHIELLTPAKSAEASKKKGGGDAKAKSGEVFVVKRGWLGGWSLTPATNEVGLMGRAKRRIREGVREWIMGWPSDQPASPA